MKGGNSPSPPLSKKREVFSRFGKNGTAIPGSKESLIRGKKNVLFLPLRKKYAWERGARHTRRKVRGKKHKVKGFSVRKTTILLFGKKNESD